MWMESLRRDGCVPVGHPTNSVMESGTCHGEILCENHSSVNTPEESPSWKSRCPRSGHLLFVVFEKSKLLNKKEKV